MKISVLWAWLGALLASAAAGETPRVAAPEPAAKTHLDYRREAAAALARLDYPAALAASERALQLRPDSARYRYDLAVVYARTDRPREALAALRGVAALGLTLPVAEDENFAPLRGLPEFAAVQRMFADQRVPRGRGAIAFVLTDWPGIVEGIAFRESTGEFFLGDVRARCVWRRDRGGTITRFGEAGDGLFGVFNLAVDEPRGLLWVTTTMVPEAVGYTAEQRGRAALIALDLVTGRRVQAYPLPTDGRDHLLGDLVLAPDGTIFVTDSVSPVVWALSAAASRIESFVESPVFASLQGVALVAGGKKLLVSDYANGLLIVDRTTRAIRALAPPPDTTLLGLDGLLADGEGLLAVQNGIEPQRVVRIALAPGAEAVTDVSVVAAALPGFDDLTLLARVRGRPHVVAGSGWASYVAGKSPPLAPHTVRVFALGIP